MAEAKAKFYTRRYQQQMQALNLFYNAKNDEFLKVIIAKTPAPTNSVTDMNLDEMIVTLSRDIESLSKIDPKAVKASNSTYKYEQIEERITQIKTVLKAIYDEQRKNEGFSKSEYREYEYIISFMEVYDSIQEKLNFKGPEYSKEDEVAEIEKAAKEYEDFQPQFISSVYEYNQYIKSDKFDASLIPEIIGKEIAYGELSSEQLLKAGSLAHIKDSIESQYNQDVESVRAISKERDDALLLVKQEISAEITRENEEYESLLQNEKDRHGSIRLAQNREIERLLELSEKKREQGVEYLYTKNVEYYKSPAFERVSDKYKNGGLSVEKGNNIQTSWIDNIGTLEELNAREQIIKDEIEKIQDYEDNLLKEIDELNILNATLSLNEKNLREGAKLPLSEDIAYISQKQALKKDEDTLKEIIEFENKLLKHGPRVISKEILSKYHINAKAIDYSYIESNLSDIRSQIGKDKLIWSKQGKNLAKSIDLLDGIFNNELLDLGLDTEDENSLGFSISENLRDNYYGLCQMLSDANNDFGKFIDKSEAICVASLFNYLDDLKALAESIKDAESEKLKDIKEGILFATSCLENIKEKESLYSRFMNIEKSFEQCGEEELLNLVKTWIEEKKNSLKQKICEKNQIIESYADNRDLGAEEARRVLYENEEKILEKRRAHEQNKFDLEFLKLCLNIVSDQIVQKSISLNKLKAKEDIEKLKIDNDNEKEWYEKNTEALLQNHISKLAIINEDRASKEEEINSLSLEKLLPYKNRIEQLKGLDLSIDNLYRCENELKQRFEALGNAIEIFKERKESFIEKITQDKISTIIKIDRLEAQAIDKVKNLKKEFGNAEGYKELIECFNQYLNKRNDLDMAMLCQKQYSSVVSGANNRVKEYIKRIEEKSIKGLKPSYNQIDYLAYLSKLFDLKESLLFGFDSEKDDVEMNESKKLEIKTEAEKIVLEKCSVKLDCNLNFISKEQVEEIAAHNRSEVDYSALLEMAEGSNLNIVSIIKNSIEKYSLGDESVFKRAVAAAILAVVLKLENPKNIAELDNREIAEKLVDVYSSLKCVSDYTEKIISHKITTKEFCDIVQTPDFIKTLNKSLS